MQFKCPCWPPDSSELNAEIQAAVSQLVDSGEWARYKSPHQELVRKSLAELSGCEHVRLCGSGSAAVEIALRAAGVGPGDEVIVAAYDYGGNFRAIEAVGAKPVLVDVAPNSVTINAEQVAQFANGPDAGSIKSVLVSHLYGVAAPVQPLRDLCDQKNWTLIEDACQVPGMNIDGRPAGSFGDIATFSFGGSKPLTAGNGGAVVTNSSRMSSRMNALLDRPSDSQPLSSLQCAVLLPQLNHLPKLNAKRRATISQLASVALGTWTFLSGPVDSVLASHYKAAWLCDSQETRDRAIEKAAANGLPMGVGFRSMSRSSERRCRKPFPLDRSLQLEEQIVLLDHTALLVEPDQISVLIDCLAEAS